MALTDKEVEAIRHSSEKQNVLACRYGVSQPQVSRIKAGKTWPTQETKYLDALNTLLNSNGFLEEMENANYHSAVEFLKEIRNYGHYKDWDTDGKKG